MSVLENFDAWKEFLGERVDQAINAGMSKEKVQDVAFRIGDYLSTRVDPENKQERLLKELWDAGNDEERQTMAKLLVNVVHKH